MARFLFDSFCGCIGLREGTKAFGIILVILKILRLIEVLLLVFLSFIAHVMSAMGGGLRLKYEVMFAMPFISAVVIVPQLVFLIKFIVKLFSNHINDYGKDFTRNLVLFGIECAAVAIFWIIMAFSYDRLAFEGLYIAVDILVIASNVFFILLMRSCIAKNYEILHSSTFNRDQDKITIPFKQV